LHLSMLFLCSHFPCFHFHVTAFKNSVSSLLTFPLYNKWKLLESFKVVSLFSYQGCHVCCLKRQLLYIIIIAFLCQQLFLLFLSNLVI